MSLERTVFPCVVHPAEAAPHSAQATPQPPTVIDTIGVEVVENVEVVEVIERPRATPPANVNEATERVPLIPFASTLRHIA